MSLLSALLGGGTAPNELPRPHEARKVALADQRARATAKANAEIESAQAQVVAAHERARRASASINEAEQAVLMKLGAELAAEAWGPSARLRLALAAWVREPARSAAAEAQQALRDLAARHVEELGGKLPSDVLSKAWLSHLVDSGHVHLVGRVVELFSDSALILACARAQVAMLAEDSGPAQAESFLREAELAAEKVAADKRGDPNDLRSVGIYRANLCSVRAADQTIAYERAIAAWRAARQSTPVALPEIDREDSQPEPAA